MYDKVEARLLSTFSELSEARKRLAEFDAGDPDFKGGKRPAGQPGAAQKPSEKYWQTFNALKSGAVDE